MKITKKLIKEFTDTVPLFIYCEDDEVKTVRIDPKCYRSTDEKYGKKTVLKILDLLENKKEYKHLLH